MSLNDELIDMYERWTDKAQQYSTDEVSDCIDKFFTLYVLYNALYVEAAAQLVRSDIRIREVKAGRRMPERSMATEVVLQTVKSTAFWRALEPHRDCVEQLMSVLETGHFVIKLDPVTGDAALEGDAKLLERLKSPSGHAKALSLLTVIYEVRCNMFHGRKGLNPRQRELLIPLICILETITQLLYMKLQDESRV